MPLALNGEATFLYFAIPKYMNLPLLLNKPAIVDSVALLRIIIDQCLLFSKRLPNLRKKDTTYTLKHLEYISKESNSKHKNSCFPRKFDSLRIEKTYFS